MYSVVLLDDEPWILKGIRKTFDWNKMGFEVIGEFTSSKVAWEACSDNAPDVIFTDIRMPNYSGIDLLKMAREKMLDTEFVVISGFAEFQYVQQALRYSAFDYCLKPIQKNDADAVLEKLRNHLDKKSEMKTKVYRAQGESDSKEGIIISELYNKKFEEMIEYIRNHYHEKLYLNELADKFYFNANYCCYLFKKMMNTTFSDFVTDLKMKEVGEIMKRDQSISIDEAARMVGYDDYYYFSKVFKKYFGITPRQYKMNSFIRR